MKPVRIVVAGHFRVTDADNLANNLSSIQGEFSFSVHEKIMNLPKGLGTKGFIPIKALEMLTKKLLAEKYPGEYPVLLCDYRLEEDLLSSFDENVAVITTHGWTRKFSPYPVQSYLAYTLADVLMNLYVDTPIHYETRGCIGDFCDNKKDINLGLARCDYCSECRSLILSAVAKGGITLSQLAAIYKILDFTAGRRSCFVLIPFNKRFDEVYMQGIGPILTRLKWSCRRADRIFQPREIMALIWEEIMRADLIIADLTGKNPNVFYELGYAHALHKNSVLITQSLEDVPFDLRQRQMIKYSATLKGYKNLSKSLSKYL